MFTVALHFQFPQISSEVLSQLAYNLFKFIDGFKAICQREKEPLKRLTNVQETFSLTIFSLVTDLQ